MKSSNAIDRSLDTYLKIQSVVKRKHVESSTQTLRDHMGTNLGRTESDCSEMHAQISMTEEVISLFLGKRPFRT